MADILIGNIKGPQGIQGETGATGAPGANGADGAAATIRVGTVSTSAYGSTAQVTNSGTESAAVFDFVIPQGKPGEETTRMSALTLDQVTASTATKPVPAVGESGAVIWGKVIKFFNDIKTAIVNKIAYDDCVANLTSTSSKLPLAANQGKALNDALSNTNANLTSSTMRVITTIASGASADINVPTGSNHLMYLAHGLAVSRGLYMVTTQGAGNVSTKTVVEAQSVVLTNGNNILNIKNNTQYSLAVYALRVNGGVMTA